MKHNLTTYGILSGIFILSLAGALLIDASEFLKAVVSAPGVTALIGALYQLVRDEAAFERQLHIQKKQSQFTLGAASHMANITFDKHVEFCEKYMKAISETVGNLFRHGDTPETSNDAVKLYQLREEYDVWLTDNIVQNLDEFEKALFKLGANAHFISKTQDQYEMQKARRLKIEENLDLYTKILGLEKKEIDESYTVKVTKNKVKNILGVEKLTKLREHLLTESIRIIKEN